MPVMLSIRSIWSATGIRNLMGLLGLAGIVTGARPIINLTKDLESSGCLRCEVLDRNNNYTFLLLTHSLHITQKAVVPMEWPI